MTGMDNVDRIQLVKLPSDKSINAEVIRKGNTIIIKLDDFRFAVAHSYQTEKWAYPMSYSKWPWQRGFVDVLSKLKMISQEEAEDIHQKIQERDRKNTIKYDKETLFEITKKYGITLSKREKDKLR